MLGKQMLLKANITGIIKIRAYYNYNEIDKPALPSKNDTATFSTSEQTRVFITILPMLNRMFFKTYCFCAAS
jgi:hypothetical protein